MAVPTLSKFITDFRLLRNLKLVLKPPQCKLTTSTASYGQQQSMIQSHVTTAQDKELDSISLSSSKVAESYLEKVRENEKFMVQRLSEFQIGRRHLANMMGEDPATFTQDDINRSIEYLFPSGLYEPRARPQMLPPSEVFPMKKEAQFDGTGRPYHSLFFTNHPHFYQVMHNLTKKVIELNKHQDKMIQQGSPIEVVDRLNTGTSRWITMNELEESLLESVKDSQYDKLIKALERLCSHNYSYRVKDFIMAYRKDLDIQSGVANIPEPELGEDGRRYIVCVGTRRMSKCIVKLIDGGKGQFYINGKNILYFRNMQDRQELIVPFMVCNVMGQFDVVCKVESGGTSGQSGALRYAIATALRSFVDATAVERMRLAGLLLLDERRKERQKPGRKRARSLWQWRKR